jgi:hypothetical protein
MMQKRRGNKSRRAGGRKPPRMAISHPPQIGNLNVRHSTRMRFILNAAMVDQSVTFQNLLDIFLIASSATTGYDLFDSVRIRAIEIWAIPVIGNATTCSVTWLGTVVGQAGQSKTVTDTSMGVQPAHIRATPGPRSAQSLYQQSGTGLCCQLTAPAGSVVDMELSFSARFASGVAAQNPLVAASAGVLYVRGFDGLPIATTKATPQVDPASGAI